MAQNVAVVNATLTATGSGTTDFTVSGFGTPSAAIVIVGDAASGFNPQASAGVSVGFWDGTNQCVHSIRAFDALGTTSTYRLSRNDYAAAFVGTSSTWSAGYSASAITDGIRLTMGVDNTSAQRFATVILLSGVSAKITRLTLSSSTNGTATTGSLGFAPTAAIVLGSGLAGNTAASGSTQSANALLSFGAATSDGAHRMIAWASSDSTATATVTSLYSETRLASQVSAGTDSWSAEVTTWGADSLTMTSRTGGSGGDDVDILCLGGADLSLLLGTLTTATSTGSADVTTTGIDPDAVLLCLGNTSSTTIASDGTASGFAVGASDGTTHGGYALVDEDAADTTNTESSYSSANAVYSRTSSGGTASDLVVGAVSMGAEKFSVNYTTVSGTARKGWFLAFGPASVGASGRTGSLSATLGALTSSATGTVLISGTASKTLGTLTSSATGTVALNGTLSKTLGALTLASEGSAPGAITGELTKTLGALTSSATGTVAITGAVSKTLGTLSLSAAGFSGGAISGELTATLGGLALSAQGGSGLTGRRGRRTKTRFLPPAEPEVQETPQETTGLVSEEAMTLLIQDQAGKAIRKARVSATKRRLEIQNHNVKALESTLMEWF